MGYTHYYTHSEVPDEVWEKIVKDCRKLYRNMPQESETAGGYYKDQPLILGKWDGSKSLGRVLGGKKDIAFNGIGEAGHESFVLRRAGSGGFAFCKTARKPYDLMVCACLIVYTFHSSSTMELGSDGDWEDWEPAMKFVESVLGANYVMKFRMEQDFG